jgi:sulfoacetaldehyde dehydrogenase
MNGSAGDEVVHLAVRRARAAGREIDGWDQARIDDAVAAVGWQCYREDTSRRLAELSQAETGFGSARHLHELNRKRVLGMLRDLDGQTTRGVVADLPHLGLRRIVKPVGVIAMAAPATAPCPGIACNVLPMLKTGNAAIVTPNPRTRAVAAELVGIIRAALRGVGAPPDLVQCLDTTGREAAEKLMAACDLVVAVGGVGTVRRAYRSGTPAIGAGVGNPTVVVDETADLADAARRIVRGAGFNNGTSCSSESNVLVHRSVLGAFRSELARAGGYLCSPEETSRVRRVVWSDGQHLDRDIVGRDVERIALAAGITLTGTGATVLVLHCDDPAQPSLILQEKLSPVLTVAGYDEFADAVRCVQSISDNCGRGHSCGIYSQDEERIARLAAAVDTSRVLVNHSTMTNAGSFDSGVPFTSVLGSGTWGGCSVAGNMTWEHLVNHTTVSRPIPENRPDEQAVFGRHWQDDAVGQRPGTPVLAAREVVAASPRGVAVD